MNEPSTWPPPPETSNLLAAHDEFLIACVRSSTPKLPLSRLRLVRDLRQETGQDLRSCLAIVNDFCDRHFILMPPTGLRAWLPFLFLGFCLIIVFVMSIVRYFVDRNLNAAVTHSEKIVLSNQRVHLDFVFFGTLLASMGLAVLAILYREKKAQADAAKAVAKFAR